MATLKKGFRSGSPFGFGAPSKIRTCDIQIRSLALYPAEPWAQSMQIKFEAVLIKH
jgi:hypothetical protein